MSQLCQSILYPRRNLRIDCPGQQAALLHLPELGGQYLGTHTANRFLQFPKPLCTRQQIANNEYLPLVADERQRCLHRAGGQSFCLHYGILLSVSFQNSVQPYFTVSSTAASRRQKNFYAAPTSIRSGSKIFPPGKNRNPLKTHGSFLLVTVQSLRSGNYSTKLCVLFK